MHRILIAIVLTLLIYGSLLSYAGTSIGSRRSVIKVARLNIITNADVERMQVWINQNNVDIVSIGFSGDNVLVVYR